MKILKNTSGTSAATNIEHHGCDFCGREFKRANTLLRHICEYKHRWLEKDRKGNRIAYQAWLHFYEKNTLHKKKRDYTDFIKSSYYTAFIKFGNYCVEVNVSNVYAYMDYLTKNKIRIDTWNTDTVYTKFLIEYLREEDPLDAIARSIEATIDLAKIEQIESHDVLRYGNKNRICYAITSGKISPWMLYHSTSGTKFLDTLDETQVKMIIDYIDPEKWAVKFKRDNDQVLQVKNLLQMGGY